MRKISTMRTNAKNIFKGRLTIGLVRRRRLTIDLWLRCDVWLCSAKSLNWSAFCPWWDPGSVECLPRDRLRAREPKLGRTHAQMVSESDWSKHIGRWPTRRALQKILGTALFRLR